MSIATPAMKNALAAAYGTAAPWIALFSTAPSAPSPGTELASAGYTREAATWSTPSAGVTTCTVTFTIAAGVTINGWGAYSASSGGTYMDGGSVTSQAFATSGTYALTITFTES